MSKPRGVRPGPGRDESGTTCCLFDLREPVVQRVTGTTYGADGILLAARVEQFAQSPDMHVYRPLVDIDVAAPYAVEQLLAAEYPTRMLQEKLQQAVFRRPKIDRASQARDAALLAIQFDVTIG